MQQKICQKVFFSLWLLFSFSNIFATTLPQVIRYTLDTNPQLIVARQNARVSEQQIKVAKAAYYPQVNVNGRIGPEWAQLPLNFETNTTFLARSQASATADQMVFDAGNTQYTVKQRSHQYKASLALLEANRNAVIFDATKAYLDILRYRRLVALAKMNMLVHEKNLQQVERLYEQKIGTVVDLSLSKSRLALAKVQILENQDNLQQANFAYEQVTGLKPTALLKEPHLPLAALPKDLRGALAEATTDNPSIIASEQDLTASAAAVEAAHSVFFPRLDIQASANYGQNVDGIPGRNSDESIMFVLSYPLFVGGSDLANYRIASAQHFRSLAELMDVNRSVSKDTVSDWTEYHYSLNKHAEYNIYANHAGEVAKGYQQQFMLNRRPLFNVLDAQQELYVARTLAINEKYNALIAAYRLLASTNKILPAVFGTSHFVNYTQ